MFDARRVAIELCECIIRWEQDRQKFLEADSSTVVQVRKIPDFNVNMDLLLRHHHLLLKQEIM
jgi:hypothetical protein